MADKKEEVYVSSLPGGTAPGVHRSKDGAAKRLVEDRRDRGRELGKWLEDGASGDVRTADGASIKKTVLTP